MSSEAQRKANAKQDATRKRVAIWLEENGPEDKALKRYMRRHRLTSRIDAVRMLLKAAGDKENT